MYNTEIADEGISIDAELSNRHHRLFPHVYRSSSLQVTPIVNRLLNKMLR